MQLPYFFKPDIDTSVKKFSLNEEVSKHAVQVLRMKLGEQLQLTNGNGLLATANILNPHKKNTVVQINSIEDIPDTRKDICLAIAPTKNINRIEWLLEKVTEIGLKRIILLQTKRTEKTNLKAERLQNIMVSAMLQSRQVYLPKLYIFNTFEQLIEENIYKEKYIAYCKESDHKTDIKNIQSPNSKIILIGPEGDFTDDEINLALHKDFKPVSLGQTRLRTETAGIVAAVALTI